MTTTTVFVELRGYNRVQNKLRGLASNLAGIIDPGMRDFAQYLRRTLKAEPYPPPPPGSTYVRTGQLANRWKVVFQALAQYLIINEASGQSGFYADYVIGYQAWMHVGRWWRAEEIGQREMPKLTEELTAVLVAYWEE